MSPTNEEEVLPRLVPGLGRTEATLGCLFIVGLTALLFYPPVGLPLLVGVGLWGVVSRFLNPERRVYAEYLQARNAFRRADYTTAVAILERLADKQWGREPILRGLAHCYYQLGRWQDAANAFAGLLAPADSDRQLAAEVTRRLAEPNAGADGE